MFSGNNDSKKFIESIFFYESYNLIVSTRVRNISIAVRFYVLNCNNR